MKTVLVIAGLDPTGGAGLLADVQVVAAHGLRAAGVVTALTEQTTAGVRASHPVSAEIVADQLRALLSDVEVAAVKIGMLGTEAIAEAVADALALTAAPVVWDPVLRPSAGTVALFVGDPRRTIALLAPHVTVVTPNADEARRLAGVEELAEAAAALRARGLEAVLVTGGHTGEARAVDRLYDAGGVRELAGERIPGAEAIHGTGCALASALACALAHGQPLAEAVASARQFVAGRLATPRSPGRGAASIV